ncbi:MAG: hypothetical protein DCF19_02820 [Pseudanabaena frigida]|uniref:Uncharacterized protein n=1 Tax=Pseudanabaena frigida TaxID=945775 RepID=A0A2W4WGD1_9CYAN|nr:MAG: hypothetical protein DCF19_02820 [Pseudanabaena frigida]
MAKRKSFYSLEVFPTPLDLPSSVRVFILDSFEDFQDKFSILIEPRRGYQDVLLAMTNRRMMILRTFQNGKLVSEIDLRSYLTFQIWGKQNVEEKIANNWIDALYLTLQENKGTIDDPVKVEFINKTRANNDWQIDAIVDWENIPFAPLKEPIIKVGQSVKYTDFCTGETWHHRLMNYDYKNGIIDYKK